jgi:hypothetical protein
MSTYRYFTWAFAVTALGLILGAWLGYNTTGTLQGAASALIICAILGILEISLSFDNAIVNATVLKHMDAVWQKRFLTWGILIAVFGMRITFPLLIVAIAAHLGPVEAIQLAISRPDEYARILTGAHVGIAAFGGTFLMMVGLKYFFDAEKEVHWIHVLEERLTRYASLEGIEIGIVMIGILIMATVLPPEYTMTFVKAALYGLLTFIAVEGVGHILDASQEQMNTVHKAGLGAFLYLEILDASFSFDGVIGAFALSNNMFIIAIGLGIGAMYVRSMTLMLVDKGTLNEFRFLEHGAFYAILTLAVIMYLQTLMHIPEVVTGLIGAALIIVALRASILWKRNNPESPEQAEALDEVLGTAAE